MISTKYIAHAGLADKSVGNHNLLICQFVNLLICAFVLSSCSGNGDEVSIEGRMLHMNQATFYVYSTDGTIDGIDTITVHGGRFDYEGRINHEGTLVVVFPNFSQLPVFVEPGASISIKGDAARLREVEVTGTKANKEFTRFREEHLNASGAEMKRIAADAVKGRKYNEEILLWLIQQQYLSPAAGDVKGAVALLKTLTQASPDNIKAKRLFNQLTAAGTLSVGDGVERFSITDIDGNTLTEKTLRQGKTVVMTCTSWNYDSHNMLRRLAERQRGKEVQQVVAICIDADRKAAERLRSNCNAADVIMVCDGEQWDCPLLRVFALATVPDNVVMENGRVTKRNVPIGEL